MVIIGLYAFISNNHVWEIIGSDDIFYEKELSEVCEKQLLYNENI